MLQVLGKFWEFLACRSSTATFILLNLISDIFFSFELIFLYNLAKWEKDREITKLFYLLKKL